MFVAAIVCSILWSVFTPDNTNCRKISRRCELARLDVKCSYRSKEISCDIRMIRINTSITHKNYRWKSTKSWHAQAFALRRSDPEMLPKLNADWNIVNTSHACNTMWDISIRRLMGYWNGPQIPVWRNDKYVVYRQSINYLLSKISTSSVTDDCFHDVFIICKTYLLRYHLVCVATGFNKCIKTNVNQGHWRHLG